MKKLPISFYARTDVVQIARELLGKIVTTNFNGEITAGRIVETEAYVAITDKASHAFAGKRTARNEHMYEAAGKTYVYICYGMHQMLNIVTNKKDIPDAILIRAIEPLAGVNIMLARTGKKVADSTLTKGPGNVGKALGINKKHSNLSLQDEAIYIYADELSTIEDSSIGSSKRIGVESAGADGFLPYRFFLKGNKYISGRPVK
ncbi:MAG: DNA-3-methyladenine glycosylase [Ferruginibacter sp.]